MARIRSPGYPSISLKEAIELAEKIFDHNRHNVIDREAAMKDMGYSGVTGQSSKIMADLGHYGLVEKAGKGNVRVTDLTVRIVHSHNSQERTDALQEAAYQPMLFHTIRETYPDGRVSENSLKSYFMRNGFASAALGPALRAYLDTQAYLQQEIGSESHRQTPIAAESSTASLGPEANGGSAPLSAPRPMGWPAPTRSGVEMMAGERVVFVDEAGASQYLKVIAAGDIDPGSLDALEDYVKRQRKRLTATPATSTMHDDSTAL